jgi:hypothetical protein
MSIFSWFSRAKKPGTKPISSDVQTGMSGMESTRPLMPAAQRSSTVAKAPADRHLQRRTERNARRELLYQVVRESMVRAGVLSSGYKFKVLSLDQRGKEFMVMIDLAAEYAGEMDKLAEIEALVARSAKNRHDVLVQALYWRFNNLPAGAQQSVSAPSHSAARDSMRNEPRPPFSPSSPAPFDAQPSMPAPLFSPSQPGSLIETFSPSGHSPLGGGVRQSMYESPGAASRNAAAHGMAARAPSSASAFEPLQADEVEAFKRALASGTSGDAATPSHKPSTPAQRLAPTRAPVEQSNNLLLTGYEATELPDPDAPDLPVLSGTQYGELR